MMFAMRSDDLTFSELDDGGVSSLATRRAGSFSHAKTLSGTLMSFKNV